MSDEPRDRDCALGAAIRDALADGVTIVIARMSLSGITVALDDEDNCGLRHNDATYAIEALLKPG